MELIIQWMTYTTSWYLMLLVLGIIFLPITRIFFGKFYDWGYGLSKAVGIGLLSYAIFTLGSIKILPFTQLSIFFVLALFGAGSVYLFRRNPIKKSELRKKLPFIIFQEILFLVAFMVWAYVRSREPAIRGLEKFMDFGFINSALQGDYFPAKDMWLAGRSINYYYFGHITGAVLTKLSSIPSYITYNLILAQLFGLGVLGAFSVAFNIAYTAFGKKIRKAFLSGLLGTFLVNLGGNLHTVYAFTMGYPNEEPVPFWQLDPKYPITDIGSWQFIERLSEAYWYPNATRFIPFTIHEFPIYSYVVADLHGHVFDIPFVLLTIALLYVLFIYKKRLLMYTIAIGSMLSMHLMTNAFDLPIYLLLSGIVLLGVFGFTKKLFIYFAALIGSFVIFNTPFSIAFQPFSSGVGFNCVPEAVAAPIRSILQATPFAERFIFENNCQVSQWWQVLTLWGFFWFNFIFFAALYAKKKLYKAKETHKNLSYSFVLILFGISTILIILPEFVYAKDIYPSHFRANTMFKLGYQAFIMMGIASGVAFSALKLRLKKSTMSKVYVALFAPLFFLVALYPTFAIESYYPSTADAFSLNGEKWVEDSFEEYAEIIDFLRTETEGRQPVIIEAQGDSYTDFNFVSSYTGLPTVAGWWVHEWLWRGNTIAITEHANDVERFYTSQNTQEQQEILEKYNVEFVVIGRNEREKYDIDDKSGFEALGKVVFTSSNGVGTVYQIPVDTVSSF